MHSQGVPRRHDLAIALFGSFIGFAHHKEGGLHVLLFQHLQKLRRQVRRAVVKGQVHGVFPVLQRGRRAFHIKVRVQLLVAQRVIHLIGGSFRPGLSAHLLGAVAGLGGVPLLQQAQLLLGVPAGAIQADGRHRGDGDQHDDQQQKQVLEEAHAADVGFLFCGMFLLWHGRFLLLPLPFAAIYKC